MSNHSTEEQSSNTHSYRNFTFNLMISKDMNITFPNPSSILLLLIFSILFWENSNTIFCHPNILHNCCDNLSSWIILICYLKTVAFWDIMAALVEEQKTEVCKTDIQNCFLEVFTLIKLSLAQDQMACWLNACYGCFSPMYICFNLHTEISNHN